VLRTISRGCLWPLLLIITFLMFQDQRSATSAASEPIWQSSQAPVAQLGVRDKLGSLGGYTAAWIVSAPDGTQYQAKKTVKGDDWGYVYFPNDFPALLKSGRYSWKCFVGGHEVIHGSFEFARPRNGFQLTVLYPF
jgi:hypothetical protein